jgi:uncharacterized protein YbaP (TraB family)
MIPAFRFLAAAWLALAPLQVALGQEVLHPALWKVQDEDTTIWLFGTVHMLPPGKDWLTGPIAQAVDGSAELVTEVADRSGADTQAALLNRAMLPPRQTLRGLLPPKPRATYEAFMKRHALPVAAFDRYKPWYAAVVLSSLPLLREGYSAKHGVEAALEQRAAVRPHGGLETADQQLALLDGLPRGVQLRYLAEVISEYDMIPTEVEKMALAWGTGDAEGLARMINEDDGKDDPLLTEVLILRRNRAWADWVRQRLNQPGTVFVAVGAGHLAGPGSVQDVLAKSGIAAVRVQ